ncbi:MAG: galactokinase family protein, partial [Acetanaerobacterium sp.]
MTASQLREQLAKGVYRDTFARLYCADEAGVCKQVGRYTAASLAFDALFGTQRTVSLFSAPGRTEIGGNHTDHQRGRVLAAAVNLDVIAVVARNE